MTDTRTLVTPRSDVLPPPGRRRRRSQGDVAADMWRIAGLSLVVLFAVGPLIWMVASSLRPADQLFQSPPQLFATGFTLDWYTEVLGRSDVILWFTNSLTVAVLTTVLSVVLGTLGGYAISRFVFPGKRPFMGALLMSYLFPAILLLLPMYLLLSTLGLIGTVAGVVLAHLAITLPLSIFLMASFASAVPRELEEAALVDGLGLFGAFRRVAVPLMRTGIATTCLFAFILSWDEYLFASAIAQGQAVTVPVALAGFVTSFDIRWGAIMALSTLVTLPIVLLFAFLQRYFEKGLTTGSVKG
jgi:ABC-type glycerol-3-phosphate transport system permease component